MPMAAQTHTHALGSQVMRTCLLGAAGGTGEEGGVIGGVLVG